MAQQTSPVNEATPKGVRSHSTFHPNYSFYNTMRFGELTPSLAIEGVSGDRLTVHCQKDIDTYTLKAPLMTAVRQVSAYAAVPMRAVLPNTAELIITNPLVGDDVDAEDCNCGIRYADLRKFVSSLAYSIQANMSKSAGDEIQSNFLDTFFHEFQLLMAICSDGSLMANLGINLSSLLLIEPTEDEFIVGGVAVPRKPISLDMLFEHVISRLNESLSDYASSPMLKVKVYDTNHLDGSVYLSFDVVPDGSLVDFSTQITVRKLCEYLRDGYLVSCLENGVSLPNTTESFEFTIGIDDRFVPSSVTHDSWKDYINLSRLAAYQIVAADFFSNDKVDAVYSAQLYRENQLSLWRSAFQASDGLGVLDDILSFSLNGIRHYYDALSCALITRCLGVYLSLFSDPIVDLSTAFPAWLYFWNLFGFQRSLRFGDYFAGAKVSPLAVGDVNIGVDTQTMSVDVIDVTRNIQRQRFLNQVNRIGRKFKDYVSGIFGAQPMSDAHEPIWLASAQQIIGAEEVENTGAAQMSDPNSKTSNLRGRFNKYAFDISVGEPFVTIIGIDYFDVPRAYDTGIDRTCLHADRYEMFNPFMQYIGDQPIAGIEIDPRQLGNFGYQLRYIEYKERVDRCAGGFRDFLPGYAVLLDHGSLSNYGQIGNGIKISSDFIRAHASEFDPLYLSLTHYSWAGYFHFIVRTDISVDAKRPMSFAPSIL